MLGIIFIGIFLEVLHISIFLRVLRALSYLIITKLHRGDINVIPISRLKKLRLGELSMVQQLIMEAFRNQDLNY